MTSTEKNIWRYAAYERLNTLMDVEEWRYVPDMVEDVSLHTLNGKPGAWVTVQIWVETQEDEPTMVRRMVKEALNFERSSNYVIAMGVIHDLAKKLGVEKDT